MCDKQTQQQHCARFLLEIMVTHLSHSPDFLIQNLMKVLSVSYYHPVSKVKNLQLRSVK